MGQEQEWSFTHAPERERRAEAAVMLRVAQVGRHVEQPAYPGGAVDEKPHHRIAGAARSGLQHVVGENHGGGYVCNDVMNGSAYNFRHGVAVTAGDGRQKVCVDAVIDAIEKSVCRFDRVVISLVLGQCVRVPGGGPAGTRAEQQEGGDKWA